jgi:uncharacterized caspase-like protein
VVATTPHGAVNCAYEFLSRSDDMPDAALIIGIQTYPDSGLPSAPFAATDAAAFAQTMTGLGIEAMLSTDAQATRTALASRLRKLIKTPPDRLFVWFGGLAFHDDGDDFLACHDLQADDRPDTAMALRDFLAAIKAVKASKTFVFLDPRRRGRNADGPDRAG